MEHVPVRQQARTQFCARETAAQLFDAWQYQHRSYSIQGPSSAVAIAFSPALQLRASIDASLIGATVSDSLKRLLQAGSCPLEALDADLFSSETISRTLLSLLTANDAGITRSEILRQMFYSHDPSETYFHDVLHTLLRTNHLLLNTSSSEEDEIALLDEIPLWTFLANIIDLSCEQYRHSHSFITPSIINLERTFRSASFSELSTQVLQQLQNGSPIAASFCTHILRQAPSSELVAAASSAESYRALEETCGPEGLHAAPVIGVRPDSDTGACEYLIQNSWGSRCDWTELECEGGKVWVSEESFEAFSFSMTWLEE